MEVTTSMGAFALELYAAQAPRTCANFLELARRGYYDGTVVSAAAAWRALAGALSAPAHAAARTHTPPVSPTPLYLQFHRVIRDFMIQGGDPTGTGRGGASIYGDKFEDELTRALKHTGAGVLSMANSGPNSNGSQFFITLAPTPHLDGKHTVFGRVASGMEVLQRLGNVQTDRHDRPTSEVRVLSARPVGGGA